LQLIFVIHNHQPVGNFGHVFEDAYRKAYLPFYELFEEAPHVRMGLHVTGPLLDFFEKEHPDFIDRIGKLASEGRVELLGGGLYEPILSSIPERDAVGQIGAMGDRLEKLFGMRPKGMWLAERVWEPDIPALLGNTEIEYTLIDDGLFAYSGIPQHLCEGYWNTECRGHPLKIFPISMKLRYFLPFKPVPMVKELLQEAEEFKPGLTLTFGDDGEKFGNWPETHDWVYGEKWLELFFQFLADESSWISTCTPSEFIASEKPRGRIYVPQASYEEMLEWTLPTDARLRFKEFKDDLKRCEIFDKGRSFLRGGTWSNFLAKYPESDWMHKRMVHVSDMFPGKSGKKGWKEAQDHLYRAQCNCAYWHGLFGGVYLNYLRHGIWENILAAEKKARILKKSPAQSVTRTDINLDGTEEHLMENASIFSAIIPEQGASVAEISLRDWNFNLTNVMTRRPEAFHAEFLKQKDEGHTGEGIKTIHEIARAKVPGLEKLLEYDAAPRNSFIDFVPWAILGNAAEGEACKVIEWKGLIPGNWQDIGDGHFALETALVTDEGWLMLALDKKYEIKGSELACHYILRSDWPGEFGFATQFNLSLLAGRADDRYLTIEGIKLEPPFMDSVHCLQNADSIELHDDWQQLKVEIITDSPVESLDISPIITVSSSEDGLEPTYQGTCFSFLRRISRPGGTELKFSYRIKASKKG
jgi:hypothetical protein